MPLSRGNAHVTFTISTGEDVVLGDTILWTEEVFLDTKTRTVDMTFSQPVGTPCCAHPCLHPRCELLSTLEWLYPTAPPPWARAHLLCSCFPWFGFVHSLAR